MDRKFKRLFVEVEKVKENLSKQRDILRDLHEEIDALESNVEEAMSLLDEASDKLSELV